MAFYTLKDFVHEQGLNMGEFNRLDKETQEKWREIHQRKLKQKLKERDEWEDEYAFKYEFLPLKHVNPDTFDSMAEWKQEEWKKQFKEWKRLKRHQSNKMKSQKRGLQPSFFLVYLIIR